jgi:hypothetical protein
MLRLLIPTGSGYTWVEHVPPAPFPDEFLWADLFEPTTEEEKAVESLLNEIAEKFADQDVGRAASMALTNLAAAGKQVQAGETRAATLTGDLQFFGLPSVMQSLSDQSATGIVTLSSAPM